MTSLPPGWARATLGDLLIAIEAGKSFACQSRPAGPGEWGVIKVSAMTWGAFRENENKAIIPGTEINASYEISPGDILLSRANTQEYVGASVLVGSVRPRLLLSDKSLRLVSAVGINRRWLAYLLSSPAVRSVISARASGTKHSMRNISQQTLREIEVRVPPAAEQERIVALLDDLLSRLDVGLAGVNPRRRAGGRCTTGSPRRRSWAASSPENGRRFLRNPRVSTTARLPTCHWGGGGYGSVTSLMLSAGSPRTPRSNPIPLLSRFLTCAWPTSNGAG